MNKSILKEVTILYVEDEKELQESTAQILQIASKQVLLASNGKEGLDIFTDNQDIDLVIADINMPKMDGLKMSEEIKKINPSVPIVITTAYNDASFLRKSINIGIAGYIMKPIDLYQMIEVITRAVEPAVLKRKILKKNKELEELNKSLEQKVYERTKELEYLATTDSLTQINNRRNFFDLGNELFDRLNGTSKSLFAVMIDIDKFKVLNDSYGHAVGDEVLRLLAKTILNMLEPTDIFGRLGGEEFAILCNCESQEEVMNKVEALRMAVEKLELNIDNNKIKFTISNGISQISENDDLDSLLARADKALYESKETGRNKSIFRV